MFTFDDVQAAYAAGREVGREERFDREVDDEINRRVFARWLGERAEIRRMATSNHGPAWARMISEQGDTPWEAA